ncbi:MAG: carbohydrate-binding domain-containing protein [Prevotella sp.]|nr:carbohydrate-binding domain-containing protein [Prevotella sp.]
MNKFLYTLAAVLLSMAVSAATTKTYTVTVAYDGTKATVTIPSEIASYVSCPSGESSRVRLIQTSTTTANPGEIIYQLSGSTDSGEFYFVGEYKATFQLNGVTIHNPDSSAVHIKDGKRIKVSMAANTVNTLSDGVADSTSKGCFHSKGHTEFAGKGTLNVSSVFNHAIYSKEYVEVKNCTLNITGAKKDGIHCQEYFLMSSGEVNMSGVEDDGIQVELKDSIQTGVTKDHEDENSGNFYMTGGTLTISDPGSYCIKTVGTITYSGTSKQVFDTANVKEYDIDTAISTITVGRSSDHPEYYDLNGRRLPHDAMLSRGIYIVKEGGKTKKVIK